MGGRGKKGAQPEVWAKGLLGTAMALLAVATTATVAGQDSIAEGVANLAYLFLASGVLLLLVILVSGKGTDREEE